MATIVKPVEQKTKHLDYFLSQCHRRRYPAKSTIIYAGDKSDSLFYIVKGSVTVIIEDDDGREMIMAYLNAGDFFGEMGLFDNMDSRSAWVKAKTECEVAEISYTKFREIAQQDPRVLYFIGEQMASRLRQTTRKVGDLAFLDVTGRVARTLLDLCKEPDAMTHPDGMQIKITRQEIGRIVGCSREMVGRVLKPLEDQGLVRVKGKTMVVYGTRGALLLFILFLKRPLSTAVFLRLAATILAGCDRQRYPITATDLICNQTFMPGSRPSWATALEVSLDNIGVGPARSRTRLMPGAISGSIWSMTAGTRFWMLWSEFSLRARLTSRANTRTRTRSPGFTRCSHRNQSWPPSNRNSARCQ